MLLEEESCQHLINLPEGTPVHRSLHTKDRTEFGGNHRKMPVLDLDLDFFLNKIAYDAGAEGGRLPEDEYSPWSLMELRNFLEYQCKLSVETPIPGTIVERHDEAFFLWRELLRKGQLTRPFDVVHVDAHADLGCGDESYVYLMQEILNRPRHGREDPETGKDKLNPGSYLAFAVACEWIRGLTYVYHPSVGNDLHGWMVTNPGFLELRACDPEIDLVLDLLSRKAPGKVVLSIPFACARADEYTNDSSSFDFITLCHSKEFTPSTSDALLDVMREYIVEI